MVMGAVENFLQISSDPKFQGWPLVGEYELGERIPFFGQVLNYRLATGNGVEDYTSLLRYFGWGMVFGVTVRRQIPTLVQWKPGVNRASWEIPPGGIGRVRPDATMEEILSRTQEAYLRETGYGGGEWSYLGRVMIETGKFRGAGPDDHGLPAHLFLAYDIEKQVDARRPNSNEIIELLEVPLDEFDEVIDSGLFTECSAVPCALLALRKLRKLGRL